MIFRRSNSARSSSTSPATPAWRTRFDEAQRLIEAQQPPSWVGDRLGAVEAALLTAESDRARLREALAQLDPERARRELKDALREQPGVPGEARDRRLALLRERHDTVNSLLNRDEALDTRIETAIVDLELLAVRAIEARTTNDWAIESELDRLRTDLTALEQAHDELCDL